MGHDKVTVQSSEALKQAALAKAIANQFPMLKQTMNGEPLVYLDNGATTQKPQRVIDAMTTFYTEQYATVHRGIYQLSQQATYDCEAVREKCRQLLNAKLTSEIIFTKGTTEAINLVAQSYGGTFLKEGDEILITGMEHHANIVPWQEVCKKNNCTLKVAKITDKGELDMSHFMSLLSPKTALVAMTHVSNVLGTINPVADCIAAAKKVGAKILLDGAQAISHLEVDVQALDCDFYCFSAHKCYGPTGIGVLYGKIDILNDMPPYQYGGDMIDQVTFEETTFAAPPLRFEAGTPAIVETIGLGAAIDFLNSLDRPAVHQHEETLLTALNQILVDIPGINLIGQAKNKIAVASFIIDNVHSQDIGALLDEQGVAVRIGHHCAQPLMARFNCTSTIRASLAAYNTLEDIEAFGRALRKALGILTA